MLGVDHKTVGNERGSLEQRGEIPHTEQRTDTTGRKQPAKKPIRTAFIDDTPEGEALFWLAVPVIGLIGLFAKTMGWMA